MAQLTLDCAYPHTFTLIEGRLLSGIQGPPELWRAGQRLIRANLALSALIYLTEGFLGHYCPDGQSSAVILLPNTNRLNH